MKFEITKPELISLCESIDTLSSLSDGIDDHGKTKKDIQNIDKFLLKNGYKRKFT